MKTLAALFFLLTFAVAMGNGAEGEKVYELPDTIQVTAERFPTPVSRIAWPSQILTAPQLQYKATLNEALDGISGGDMAGYGAVGQVSNLFLWGAPSSQILLLYDGRPVYNYATGGFNLSDYNADEFSRIEIVKGTQSSLYGSDAIGGVINLIPKFEYLNKISGGISGGNNNYVNYHALVSRALENFHINAEYEGTGTDNVRSNSGVWRDLASVRSLYLPSRGNIEVSLGYRYFRDSLGLPGSRPDPNNIPYYGNSESRSLVNHQSDRNHSLDARINFNGAAHGFLSGEIDLFYEKKTLRYLGRYAYLGMGDSTDVIDRSENSGRNSGVTGRVKWERRALSLAGGAEYLSGEAGINDVTTSQTIYNDARPPLEAATPTVTRHYRDNYALWAGSTWKMFSFAEFDLSGRGELVNGRKGFGSMNAGLRLAPAKQLQLNLAFGSAYRLPSFNDLYWPSDEFTAGNPDLKPEKGINYMAAVSYAPVERLAFNADLFVRSVKDLISWAPQGAVNSYGSPRWTPTNLNRFRTTGIDLGIKAAPDRNSSIEGDFTWQEAYQKNQELIYSGAEGSQIFQQVERKAAFIPNLKWRIGYFREVKNINFNGELIYTALKRGYFSTSSYDASFNTYYTYVEKQLKANYLINGSISFPVRVMTTIVLSVNDLFDTKPIRQFGGLNDRDYPSIGRTFLISLNFRLD